jgi:hypothetical protein
MAQTLGRVFADANSSIEATEQFARAHASLFLADSTREQVMRVHQYCKQTHTSLTAAQGIAGIDAFAAEQWGPTAPGFTTKTNEIKTALQDVLNWIQSNFPTVLSTLNASMTALGYSAAQQNALRAQMGANLDYVLTHQIQSGVIVSPTLPASALAPLVTLLNSLATAATMP